MRMLSQKMWIVSSIVDIKEVFIQRRSVRKFKNKEIDDEIINDIIYAAISAPSTDTCNLYFGIIRDSEIKEQIGEATVYANWVSKAPVIFVCCSDIEFDIQNEKPDSYAYKGLSERYGKEIVDFFIKAQNRKSIKTLIQSAPAYVAAEHIILSANSHGLKGCLVDFIDLEKINEILNLPENITCELIVPIGYPDEPKMQIKINKMENVFYERW